MADFFESTLAGIRMAAQSRQESPRPSKYRRLCVKSVPGIRSPNNSRVTGKPETIDASVGLVPRNALAVTDQLPTRSRRIFPEPEGTIRDFSQAPKWNPSSDDCILLAMSPKQEWPIALRLV